MPSPLLFLAAFFAFATSVNAADQPVWKRVGDWQIRVDTTLNYGCFMFALSERGTAFRVGFDKTAKGGGYLILANDAWKSLEIGKEYDLAMQFDSEAPWNGSATALTIGSNTTALYVTFSDAKFLHEVMRKQRVVIKYRDTVVSDLGLRGSHAAGEELVRCQTAIDENRSAASTPKSDDPFVANSSSRRQRDPFSF